MNGIFCAIGHHIVANAEAYGMGAIAFLVSAGKCMPKPGSKFCGLTLYAWLYDTVQSVLPLPRTTNTNPTNPETPAK